MSCPQTNRPIAIMTGCVGQDSYQAVKRGMSARHGHRFLRNETHAHCCQVHDAIRCDFLTASVRKSGFTIENSIQVEAAQGKTGAPRTCRRSVSFLA
jgi:hypothetical protein